MRAQVLGIDPGQDGALAWVNRSGQLVEVEDMPCVDGEVNERLLSALVVAYGPIECAVVEKAQSMPKQGVAGVFKYGVGFGIIKGVLATLDIPTHYRTSSEWKKAMRLNSDKERSRKMAIERWPASADAYFKLKKHHGRAEAALLALWWVTSQPSIARRVVRRVEVDDE